MCLRSALCSDNVPSPGERTAYPSPQSPTISRCFFLRSVLRLFGAYHRRRPSGTCRASPTAASPGIISAVRMGRPFGATSNHLSTSGNRAPVSALSGSKSDPRCLSGVVNPSPRLLIFLLSEKAVGVIIHLSGTKG